MLKQKRRGLQAFEDLFVNRQPQPCQRLYVTKLFVIVQTKDVLEIRSRQSQVRSVQEERLPSRATPGPFRRYYLLMF